MDDLIEHLKRIGLNSYEARVYLTLLKKHPATGYEISKNANIPQARAYDTLKSLEIQKLVVATEGKPTMYMPVSPDEVLERFRKDYKGSIDYLRNALPKYVVQTVEPIHNIHGFDAIYAAANRIIRSAQKTIFVEIWREDEPYLKASLEDAHQRGVKIYVVGYKNVTLDYGETYHHDRESAVELMTGSRWFIVAADSEEVLITVFPTSETEPFALWTKNPTIVLLMKDLMIHDIFLLDVESTLKEPMAKAYGTSDTRLREKIFGAAVNIGAH